MTKSFNLLSKYLQIRPSDLQKKRIYRVQSPLKPHKARIYGYKSTPYMMTVVGSFKKGGIEPRIPARGRTPSKIYSKYGRNVSLKEILKRKVEKTYPNMKLKGYYFLCQNGKTKWYEFVLEDSFLKSELVSC